MTSGTVKWFNGPSGYGVIAADVGGGELFVYRGSLLGVGATLDAGDRVEFEVHEGGMGAQAIDVQHAGAVEEAPLDWREFSARFFPHGRRHDLQAIVAYGAHRAGSIDRAPEQGGSALVGS